MTPHCQSELAEPGSGVEFSTRIGYCFVPKRRKNEELHMQFPIRDWDMIAEATRNFEVGSTYRYAAPRCRICFGWETLMRRNYADVMSLRGVWDGQEVRVKIPSHHWFDILTLMKVRPTLQGADRMSILMDD